MIRKVIKIDEEKCVGCSLCVNACQQSAIKIIDKKAKLVSDDYCDGLGNCLPVCPTNAITFEERDTLAFDLEKSKQRNQEKSAKPVGTPCSMATKIKRPIEQTNTLSSQTPLQSKLSNWPVQIKLVPTKAEYYDNANLLIAADCCAYAYADFHKRFIDNRIAVIGCPKLDDVDYSEKLTQIISENNIKSITIVKMEVPCCNGILMASKTAIKNSDKMIPWQIVTVTRDGNLIEN